MTLDVLETELQYSWRKGMLTWDWGDTVVSGYLGGFVMFVFTSNSWTVGLPEEPK